MQRLKKILFTLLILILILVILLPAVGYFAVVRPALPQLDGDITAAELTAVVTVQRDENGIPH
ncbi:MAG: hypothetical protein KAG66_17320, partial [Methylococcales bacterium]|nr:hypothetical protein [Methylococcales bacterium]